MRESVVGFISHVSPCRAGAQGHDAACQHCQSGSLNGEWETVYTGEDESLGGYEDWFCCHTCRDAGLPCETFHRIPINAERQENDQ